MTFKANTSEYNAGIKKMESAQKSFRSELKLNATQMKGVGESAELLKERHKILSSELAASREKTVLLNNKLTEAKKMFGENSEEASILGRQLTEAKNVEAAIQNEISQTNAKIKEQENANSSLTQSIQQSDEKMKQLDQELALNAEKLEGASDKTELLKEKQTLLGEKSQESANKVRGLEQALEQCADEVGENSSEYEELKSKLLEAKTEQAAIQNEIRNTSQELKNQKTQLQEAGKALETIGKGATSAGQSLKGVSRGATVGLAGAGAAAVSFESAFAGVMKTTDEVYDSNGKCVYSYAQLEEGIRNMAKEIPSSTTEIAKVAETAGQLGIKTEDILGFTRVMIDLGNSTNLASEEASSSIAKFANVTGLAADQTMSAEEKYRRVGSTIVELGNNYATTEADIMNMAQNIASAGAQVGMSEAEILALATSLSSVGMEAQAGGTAFSKALVEMQLAVETNSESLKDWADVAGMSTDEFSRMFKEDAAGALEAFIGGLSQCGGETESAIKVLDDMGITETRMRDALLRSANASDVFTSALKTGKEAWEENTALTEEAEKRYETTASQLSLMKNHINDVGITLGSIFLPMINGAAEKISGFADKLAGADENTQKIILGVTAFVAILSPLLIGIGKISTGISAVIGVGSKLSGIFTGAGAAAMGSGAATTTAMLSSLAPILAVLAAVAAVIAILVLLWNKSDEFREFFTGMWEALKDTIQGFLERINFGDKIDAIKEKFSGLGEKLSGLGNFFKVLGTVLAVYILPTIAALSGTFNALLNAISAIITIIGGLVDILSGLGSMIVGIFTGDLDLAKEGASTFISGIGQVFGGLWDLVSGILTGFVEGVVSFFGSLYNSVKNTFSSIYTTIMEKVNQAKSIVQTGFNLARTYIISPITSAYSTVSSVFSNIYSTISGKINSAKNAVKTAIDAIKGFFNFTWKLPDIKLPHFSITGSFSLTPPSVPKLSVKWYKDGAIFNRPTLFPTMYGWKGVGEAGPEAVAPISKLMDYVEESLTRTMQKITYARSEPIDYDRLAEAMAAQPITAEINGRELVRILRDEGVIV